MNLLTHPFIDLTNERFDVSNRQMNRMVAAFDVNDSLDNHNVHNEKDIFPSPPPEHEHQERLDMQYGNVQIVERNQDLDNVVNKVR